MNDENFQEEYSSHFLRVILATPWLTVGQRKIELVMAL